MKAILILFFMAIPPVWAIDCGRIQNPDCQVIQDSNLSQDVKDLLSVNLLYHDNYVPDHDLVESWNRAIVVSSPPENTTILSSSFIKDAWVRILTVMPGVQEDGILYVSDKISVLCQYSYRVEVPSDYESSGYPETLDGDCKREHFVAQNTPNFKAFGDGIFLSDQKSFLANIGQNTALEARFTPQVAVLIRHYSWKRVCCRWQYGHCVQYCWRCQQGEDENKVDLVSLSDRLNLTYYPPTDPPDFRIVNRQWNNTYAKITPSKANFGIFTQNASYETYYSHYSLNYSLKPYYFLTIHALPINESRIRNMYLDNDTLIFQGEDCAINYSDHFNNSTTICNTIYNPLNLVIKTDKTNYKEGEFITVTIEPGNLPVNVQYGNENFQATRIAILRAQTRINKIIATSEDYRTEAIINVEAENLNILILLGTLVSANCVIFIIVKKNWGRFL